jgi:2-polyprenyl-6-methoxyphenol hydroxylase-like FAD-dependent oxidoreductase
MSSFAGRRARVIGAGLGGLSMAGVLARYFVRVDVLERDHLPSSAVSRAGTPQDRHPHALLSGGLEALSEIFPGFQADLANAGAIPVRLAEDFRHERGDVGLLPMRDLGISLLSASRPPHLLGRP